MQILLDTLQILLYAGRKKQWIAQAAGFRKHFDKLVFVRTSAAQYLPPGGRGTAKRWMRNGDTLPFAMQLIQTVQTFPMYLFHEMHTNMEHIAVPHPPQCAHWGTFPPGEGMVQRIPANSNLSGCWGKTIYIFFKMHPRRGYHILYLNISYLISVFPAPSATGDRKDRPYAGGAPSAAGIFERKGGTGNGIQNPAV